MDMFAKDLEDEAIWKLGVLACVALPSVPVVYRWGDQVITIPFSKLFKNCALKDIALKVPIAVWILGTSVLIVAAQLIGKHDEGDIACSEEKWRPMIPLIGSLYITPLFGTGSQISQNLQHVFGPLLFLNLFSFFGVHDKPALVMPTMNAVRSKHAFRQRLWYFIPRYVVFILSSCALWEFMWLVCAQWHSIISLWQRIIVSATKLRQGIIALWQRIILSVSELQARKKTQAANLSDPLLSDTSMQQAEQPQAKESEAAAEQSQAKESEFADKQVEPEEPEEPQVEEPEEPDKAANAEDQWERKTRTRDVALVIIFNTWYTLYQVLLYQWTDVIVAGGLINLESGTVWEMWSLVLQFGFAVHTLVIIVRYYLSRGVTHQHPILLILPAFLPWVGNELHIWKDHASQGLSFAVSHCFEDQSPTLSKVGLFLGYAGFAATFYSAWVLLRDETCHEGLISSHWPASTSPPSAGDGFALDKTIIMSTMIGANTKEKRLRAYNEFLETWECSPMAAQRYMLNLEVYGGNSDPILNLALRKQWKGLLTEFWFINEQTMQGSSARDSSYHLLKPSIKGTKAMKRGQDEAKRPEAIADLRPVQELQDSESAVTTICFGQERLHKSYILLATGSKDGTVVLYRCYRTSMEIAMMSNQEDFPLDDDHPPPPGDFSNIAVHSRLVGHSRAITCMFFNLLEDQVVTTSIDKSLRIWSVNTAEMLKTFDDDSPVTCAAFLPFNPHLFIVANYNSLFHILNHQTGRVLPVLHISEELSKDDKDEVRCMKFDDTGSFLFAGTKQGFIHVLEATDPNTMKFNFKVQIPRNGGITCIIFVPASYGQPACLLVNSSDSAVTIINCTYTTKVLTDLTVRHRVRVAHSLLPLKCCYSPSGQGYLISGSEDKEVYIFSLAWGSDQKLLHLKHHVVPVVAVAVNFQDTLLASADSLGRIVLWRRLDFSHLADAV